MSGPPEPPKRARSQRSASFRSSRDRPARSAVPASALGPPSASASSDAAVVPRERATSARRPTEMFPDPASNSARKRSETPELSESARRDSPRSSRRRRTAAPIEPSSESRGAPIGVVHYNALFKEAQAPESSNIVLAFPFALRYLSARMDKPAAAPQVVFETHPSRYRHWSLAVEGEIARLTMKVEPFGGANDEVELKSNSYDLSVDIELADAVQRLRFTHPQVKAVVVTSGHDKIFCAGANIYMLAASTHPFKVNFCKYTNETRLSIEEASAQSGIKFLAACNGATAGGGYELALACDEIVLVDDGSSTISLPEVPLLGVLPGTGGLTRVVDKRKVRRDLADAFSTLAEGVKGKRAVEWGLVDAVVPRSKFKDTIAQRARGLAAKAPDVPRAKPVKLDPIGEYRHVSLKLDEKSRIADLTVRGPADAKRVDDASFWPLRMARELDHALLRLRFEHENVGLVLVRTEGDRKLAHEIGEV